MATTIKNVKCPKCNKEVMIGEDCNSRSKILLDNDFEFYSTLASSDGTLIVQKHRNNYFAGLSSLPHDLFCKKQNET